MGRTGNLDKQRPICELAYLLLWIEPLKLLLFAGENLTQFLISVVGANCGNVDTGVLASPHDERSGEDMLEGFSALRDLRLQVLNALICFRPDRKCVSV